MQIGRLKIHFFCCLKDNAPRSMAESFIILNGMLIIIDVVDCRNTAKICVSGRGRGVGELILRFIIIINQRTGGFDVY